MDVLSFINSRAIREHLKSISYEFNSLETAWLIYQCHSINLREKHDAWRELIATTPDCEMPRRRRENGLESLHEFLADYIKAEEAVLEDIASPSEGCLYELRTHTGMILGCFTDYDKCLQDDSIADYPCDVIKHMPDTDLYTEVHLSKKKEPTYAYDAKSERLRQRLRDLWFCFPTPFKPGDILCEYSPEGWETNGYCKGPFVMTSITDEQTASKSIREAGDFSDMIAWGYFQREDGTIYHENMWNYMDLEYYRGDLHRERGILKGLSSFIKGDIDVGLFANAYHSILLNQESRFIETHNYTKEGRRLAGVKNDAT